MQWRADLLFAGRYEDLSREYLYPLAVYLEDRLMVLHTPAMLMAAATHLRDALVSRNVTCSRFSLSAVELPRDKRFRVWGTWQDMAANPAHTRRSTAVYYMRETDDGYQSEMLHFPQLGTTEMFDFNPPQQMIA